MNSLSRLTWKCHVCGDVRPDALIGVYSRDVEFLTGGEGPPVMARENVRYCLDRPACVEGAKHVHWMPERAES